MPAVCRSGRWGWGSRRGTCTRIPGVAGRGRAAVSPGQCVGLRRGGQGWRGGTTHLAVVVIVRRPLEVALGVLFVLPLVLVLVVHVVFLRYVRPGLQRPRHVLLHGFGGHVRVDCVVVGNVGRRLLRAILPRRRRFRSVRLEAFEILAHLAGREDDAVEVADVGHAGGAGAELKVHEEEDEECLLRVGGASAGDSQGRIKRKDRPTENLLRACPQRVQFLRPTAWQLRGINVVDAAGELDAGQCQDLRRLHQGLPCEVEVLTHEVGGSGDFALFLEPVGFEELDQEFVRVDAPAEVDAEGFDEAFLLGDDFQFGVLAEDLLSGVRSRGLAGVKGAYFRVYFVVEIGVFAEVVGREEHVWYFFGRVFHPGRGV